MKRTEEYKEKDILLFQTIEKVKNGQEADLNQIYEASKKYIYKIINDIVKNHHTTEDLMQETYIQIFSHLDSLVNTESFYVWAGRIATNLTLRYIKKNRHEVLAVADDEGNTDFVFECANDDKEAFIPEEILESEENRRLLTEIIDALSVDQKLTVQYFYYEEMSVREIAEQMEVSEGTVKSRLNYARNSIKKGVLDLEEKKGTKLYSLASLPLFWFIFRESLESSACAAAVSNVSESVAKTAVQKAYNATKNTGSTPHMVDSEATKTVTKTTASQGLKVFVSTTTGKVALALAVVGAAIVAGGIITAALTTGSVGKDSNGASSELVSESVNSGGSGGGGADYLNGTFELYNADFDISFANAKYDIREADLEESMYLNLNLELTPDDDSEAMENNIYTARIPFDEIEWIDTDFADFVNEYRHYCTEPHVDTILVSMTSKSVDCSINALWENVPYSGPRTLNCKINGIHMSLTLDDEVHVVISDDYEWTEADEAESAKALEQGYATAPSSDSPRFHHSNGVQCNIINVTYDGGSDDLRELMELYY